MKRNMPKDAHILLPVSVRLPADVVSEARAQGEYVRGGASQVLRAWIERGMKNFGKFSRKMYDAPIHRK
jgi:uncharacterized protein (DUF4415 family)